MPGGIYLITLLNSLGDRTSRVMPIEKIEQRFKVSFASEFAFDPDDIISIVECAIEGTGIDNCLVELEQCRSVRGDLSEEGNQSRPSETHMKQ